MGWWRAIHWPTAAEIVRVNLRQEWHMFAEAKGSLLRIECFPSLDFVVGICLGAGC